MPSVSGSLSSRSETDSKKGCIAPLLILISSCSPDFPCSEVTVFLHLVDSKDQETETVSCRTQAVCSSGT